MNVTAPGSRYSTPCLVEEVHLFGERGFHDVGGTGHNRCSSRCPSCWVSHDWECG